VDVTDTSIPTPVKHAFQVVALGRDGYIYTATGGCLDSKWDQVAADVIAALQSFQILS
jgi:hypothetical protein